MLSHKVQYSLTYTASKRGESPKNPLFIKTSAKLNQVTSMDQMDERSPKLPLVPLQY